MKIQTEDVAFVGTPLLLKIPNWIEFLSPMLKDLSNLAAIGVAIFGMAHYAFRFWISWQEKRINDIKLKKAQHNYEPNTEEDRDDS